MSINKVAVIGAGVMGASIAAHISNAGVPVLLFDRVPETATDRNVIAQTAIQNLLKAEPPALMRTANARLITAANVEDHLHLLADADWVIEAVIEEAHIKKALYQQLDAVCHADCLISSNTSTLPLHVLVDGLSEGFKQRFIISHFFNPPRYMRLLEFVASPQTRPELITAVREFADTKLGKDGVMCQDTPGFIGNRLGVYWLQCSLQEAIALGLTSTEADAVMTVFGIPKTGVFGLLDLIGLDLIPHVLSSMTRALAPNDAFQQVRQLPDVVQTMIAQGLIGRKAKAGFYRLNAAHHKEAIDLNTGIYGAISPPDLGALQAAKKSGLANVLSHTDLLGIYAWRVFAKTLSYAASLLPEVTNDAAAIDTAMREGYNWRYGPFELLDQIGVAWFIDKLQAEQLGVPPFLANKQAIYHVDAGQLTVADLTGQYHPVQRAKGIFLLADAKRQHAPVLTNRSASLWDVGDGVACLELHSKMNTLDHDNLSLLGQSIACVKHNFAALVIHNDSEHFSAGANLSLLPLAIHNQDWATVEQLIDLGQQTYLALKYAPFPVVGAPSGLALGGGCEILLHCDAIQAHAELYMGLVEVGVGLIPCWGGCKEYLQRCLAHQKNGLIPPISAAFETIALAKVSKSAADAQDLLFLAASDGITANKNRLLAEAKAKALLLTTHYQAPQAPLYTLPGKTAKIRLSLGINALHSLGKASDYDVVISHYLADILSGGDCDMTLALTENELLTLEKKAFLALVQQSGTLARLEHLLKTGKTLRN